MVHPAFLHLLVRDVDAIFLHHQEIEVFHIGVIVGEGTVHGGHLGHGLVKYEGTFAGFIDKLVFVFQSIDIAYHLA